MFQKVAVPLDGSDVAEQILPYVAILTKATRSTLMLVRVEKPFQFDFPDLPSEIQDRFERWTKSSAQAYLDKTKARLSASGMAVDTAVLHGRAAEEIARYAQEQGADLIALATHGRAGFDEWRFGSIAADLSHHCPLPLLTLRIRPDAPSTAAVRQIVVPLDGSTIAEQALSAAAELARTLSVPLHLIRVVPKPVVAYAEPDDPKYYVELEETFRKTADQYLEKQQVQLQSGGLSLETKTIVGLPSEGIIEYAKSREGSLVCMTTHTQEGLRRLFLGSVASTVRQEAFGPVLLIRPE